MCLFTMQKKVVIVDDIVNVLLPIKLKRFQMTEEEYRIIRRSGVTDNDLEKIYLSGKNVYSFSQISLNTFFSFNVL